MQISRNTYQGLLGVTTTSVSGVWNIDELDTAPLSYFAPNVVSTASTETSTTITLPSGITVGQTIIIFTGSGNAITTTSVDPYTKLQGNINNNYNTSIFYKIANGTEGGTSLRISDTALSFGCAVLDRGTPDYFGTLSFNGSGIPAPASITPSKGSLAILSSFNSFPDASDPTNSVGFTDVVIDGTNNTGDDFYIWSKVSDGSATGIATVTWSGQASGANLFSFSKRSITNRSAATLISTSSGIGNTMTLGTVNSGNLIFLFLSGRTNPVAPSGFISSDLSIEKNPKLRIATKISDGTETTLTGTWEVAASVVVDGHVSGIGGPVTSSVAAVTTKNALPSASLCAYWTVIDATNTSITTPPSGWTEKHNMVGANEEGYLYTREYTSAQQTGDITATWGSATLKIAALVSFYK